MSHYRLNYLNVRLILAKAGTERVPQMMTGEVRNDYRLPVLVLCLHNLFSVVGFVDPPCSLPEDYEWCRNDW